MENNDVTKRLDTIIELLQILVATELCKSGVPQVTIGKRLHVKTAKVGKILEGIKRQK